MDKQQTNFYNYLAGFVDGDGRILAQLVKREDYKFKFQIRVSVVLYQKTTRLWFLTKMQKQLDLGTLRSRKHGMCELAIVGSTPVETVLKLLLPHLVVKRSLAKLVIKIIDDSKKGFENKAHFIEVCKLIDEVANFTDSKKRTITASVVEERLLFLYP